MRAVLIFLGIVAVIGVGMSKSLDKRLSKPTQPAAMSAQASADVSPPRQTSSGYRTVTLRSDRRGHFQVEARIDGRRIELVVDTGASMIILRESSAARLGIFPRANEYIGRAQTANGVAKFAPVRLNSVEVDGIRVHDVKAAVMHDEALGVNLLGMTFLSRVKWSHEGGRLVLEQ
jgi:aspartyl protease family protein